METETNRRRREYAQKHKGGKTVYVDYIRVRVVYTPSAEEMSPKHSGSLMGIGIF